MKTFLLGYCSLNRSLASYDLSPIFLIFNNHCKSDEQYLLYFSFLYFLSDLPRLFRYLRQLSIKAKLLNFKSISSSRSKIRQKLKKVHQNRLKGVTEEGAMAVLELLGTNRLDNYQ